MRVITEEIEGEGLESLLGKRVMIMCLNYIYTGKLIGVNTTVIKLADPKIVFDTGSFNDKDWKFAESLPHEHYVNISAIESFGESK